MRVRDSLLSVTLIQALALGGLFFAMPFKAEAQSHPKMMSMLNEPGDPGDGGFFDPGDPGDPGDFPGDDDGDDDDDDGGLCQPGFDVTIGDNDYSFTIGADEDEDGELDDEVTFYDEDGNEAGSFFEGDESTRRVRIGGARCTVVERYNDESGLSYKITCSKGGKKGTKVFSPSETEQVGIVEPDGDESGNAIVAVDLDSGEVRALKITQKGKKAFKFSWDNEAGSYDCF